VSERAGEVRWAAKSVAIEQSKRQGEVMVVRHLVEEALA
jgi:hypothetical protein